MDIDEYHGWQLFFASNPFPADALLDQVAAVISFLESAWTRKPVKIAKHRVKYEKPQSAQDLERKAQEAAGSFASGWSS